MGFRRKSRELAIQTMYALDFEEIDPQFLELELLNRYKEKLAEIFEASETETDGIIFEFADNLILNTYKNLHTIDINIEKHSLNWTFEKIALVDKSIMRIATYELLFTDTAPAIIMDEAIEISKKFCSENSKKFINGILNAISHELEKRTPK